MTNTQFAELLDGLKECRAVLGTITPAWLSSLNDAEFEYVVTSVAEFFETVQSMADYLAEWAQQKRAPKIIRSGRIGCYDFHQIADGSCVIKRHGFLICVQPSAEAMRQWVMGARNKQSAT
jgi:hypothetical protein